MALNKEQSKALADKLMTLANISVGGLVFGALISAKKVQILFIIIGIVIYIVLTLVGLHLLKEEEN